MGIPFLASPPNQALYPIRVLSILMNFLDYERLFIVAHVLLISMFSFLLVKKRGGSNAAGVFALLALGFNGFVLARVTTNIDLASMAWIPAAFYALETENPIALGVVLALQWMAGFPTFTLLTGLLLLVASALSRNQKRDFQNLLIGGVIAFGLSAIQILPFLQLMKESARPTVLNSEIAVQYSLLPAEILRPLLLPSVWLNQLKPLSNSDPAVIGFYLGPIFLIFFGLGLWKGKSRVRWWGGCAIFFFVMCLGKYNFFYRHIPFITVFRFPAHWLLPAIVCATFVAVEGFQKISNTKIQSIFLLALGIDLLFYAWPMKSAWCDLDFLDSPPEVQTVGFIAPNHRIFHAANITDTVNEWSITKKNDWLTLPKLLVPSIGLPFGWKEVASRHQLPTRRQVEFIRRLNGTPFPSPIFDEAGIETIVALKNPIPASTEEKANDAIVINNPSARPLAYYENGDHVKILKQRSGHFVLATEKAGRVVVAETYFPGWELKIDGKKAPLEIFDQTFLSAQVPEGIHEIEFKFCPSSFTWGATISILTLGILIYVSQRRRHVG